MSQFDIVYTHFVTVITLFTSYDAIHTNFEIVPKTLWHRLLNVHTV